MHGRAWRVSLGTAAVSLVSPKLASPGLRRALIAVALLGSGASWAADEDPVRTGEAIPARAGEEARAGETARAGEPRRDDARREAALPAVPRREERSYAEVVQQIEATRRQLARPTSAAGAAGDAVDDGVAAASPAATSPPPQMSPATSPPPPPQRSTSTPARLARAERALQHALVDEILPRWLGVPWSSEARSVARQPAAGATVHCASFVIAALEGAGVRFAHRDQLAQAPALRILEALAGEGGIARWQGTVPEFERELLRRGPGVYLLGLTRHIGFAVVGEGEVHLVHASRTAGTVVVEPMARSRALARAHGTAIFAAALLGARDRDRAVGGDRGRGKASGDRAVGSDRGKASGGGEANPLVRRWLAGALLGPS